MKCHVRIANAFVIYTSIRALNFHRAQIFMVYPYNKLQCTSTGRGAAELFLFCAFSLILALLVQNINKLGKIIQRFTEVLIQ